MDGWIKVHRRMLDWEWYKDSVTKDVFIHLLLTASHKPTKFKGERIPAGGVPTSIAALADALGFSQKQIRTALSHLEKSGEIRKKRARFGSVIVLRNYAVYQHTENEQRADKGQTKGKQRANPYIDKNIRSKECKNINTARTREEPSFNISKFNDYVDSVELKYRKEVAE